MSAAGGSEDVKAFKNKKICCGRKHGEVELFGLILLIIGICTICVFILPSKLLLILLAGLMIFCGFKLFNS